MPNIELFSDNTHIYSTALMFAYINVFKPKIIQLSLEELSFNLEFNCWANNVRPIDVIEDIRSIC